MSRISVGRPHPRPCAGRKTLRRRINNQDSDNVILIDVDSEHFDNVIIIDVPESLQKKFRGPSKPRADKSFTNVIYIDDDETPDTSQPDVGFKNGTSCGLKSGCSAADASSSKNPCHGSMNFADAAATERQFVQENVTPVRLSKCKRTYSGKGSARNHYGLNTDSESDSSDSDDYPDCELMEDSSGKVQEQWEKAFYKRKKDFHGGHSGAGDRDSTSGGINENHHENVETEGETRQHKNAAFYSRGSTSFDEPESLFSSMNNGVHSRSSHVFHDPTADDFSMHSPPELHDNKADACFQSNSQDGNSPFIYTKVDDHRGCVPESSRRHVEERSERPASSNTSRQEQSPEEVNCPSHSFKDKEAPITEPCPLQYQAQSFKGSSYGKGSSVEHEAAMYKCRNSFETGAASSSSLAFSLIRKVKKVHNNFEEKTTGSVKEGQNFKPLHPCATGGAKDLMPDISPVRRSTLPDDQANQSFFPGDTAASFSGNSHSSMNFFVPKDDIKKTCHQEKGQPVSEMSLPDHIHFKEARFVQDSIMSNSPSEEDKHDNLHSQNGDALLSVESYIISERELLKETDEYKRAIEEEWASRKQALQVQAEEAQRLRQLQKRRKAEAMRLLDMERRQKQRVEEMRNVQKRDEENLNLREVIRAEIRKDLKKLEVSCHTMSSLLHCLGIRVGGWPQPLPQEVQTAYKKALLTFHPDRVSRSDIRQQVEAEEKFKLVNRLKEKFSTYL